MGRTNRWVGFGSDSGRVRSGLCLCLCSVGESQLGVGCHTRGIKSAADQCLEPMRGSKGVL